MIIPDVSAFGVEFKGRSAGSENGWFKLGTS